MSHWIRTLSTVGWALLVGVVVGLPRSWAQEAQAVEETLCAECHDELVREFLRTPHASKVFSSLPQAQGASACEACHGDGTGHVEEMGDPELISVPRGVDGHGLCLECHDAELDAPSLGTAAHAGGGVHCGDCHSIHPSLPARIRLLREEPDELCASCHPAQQSSFRKPFAHRLGRGGMQCFSCHDPHGGRGARSLKTDRTGEGPCLSCHAEKKGPFVFSHVTGMVGDCLTCHEAHGSTNDKRLVRSRVDLLCLECHTGFPAGTLGSQPPSFHNLRSPRFRECTTCHVAVHGSNSSPLLLK